jgi:hypothetical protein
MDSEDLDLKGGVGTHFFFFYLFYFHFPYFSNLFYFLYYFTMSERWLYLGHEDK